METGRHSERQSERVHTLTGYLLHTTGILVEDNDRLIFTLIVLTLLFQGNHEESFPVAFLIRRNHNRQASLGPLYGGLSRMRAF